MSHRWTCPSCGNTILAPSRMNHLDPRRFCLPCSDGQPRMVVRTCAALERERAEKQTRVNARRARTREQQRAAKEAEKVDAVERFRRAGIDVPTCAAQIVREIRRQFPDSVMSEMHVEQYEHALVRRGRAVYGNDPDKPAGRAAWVIASMFDVDYVTAAQGNARILYEVAEALYGARARGDSECRSRRLYLDIRVRLHERHDLHRMIATFAERDAVVMPKRRPTIGDWLDAISPSYLDEQLHEQVPSISDILRATGLDVTERAWPELLVPLPKGLLR